MADDRPTVARTILTTLFQQADQRDRRRAMRVRLNEHQHAPYFSTLSVVERQDTNAALQALEASGIVSLRWKRFEEGYWLEAVDLVPGQAPALGERLGLKPRTTREETFRRLLERQTPRGQWHESMLQWLGDRLTAERSLAPFDLDKPEWNEDLFRLLDAVATVRTPTLLRTLSVRLYADSKRASDYLGAVVSVLRRHDPEATLYGDETWAVLRGYNVENIPEYIPLAGPLCLRQAGGQLLDLTPFASSVALPATILAGADVVGCTATAVITVENATSFHELVLARPPELLIVYTGGFASPAILLMLARLRRLAPALPFYHWGDLDAGGLRILAHLRAHLGPVAPVAMDAATLIAGEPYTQPLTPADCVALERLQEAPLLKDCAPLIKALLVKGGKLEQEAVSAAGVVSLILDRPAGA